MRRVGTLTSAFTMLALGLLLLADTIWNRNYFVSGLNFWPLIVVGLGLEILFNWLTIRRKHLPEAIRLDGRSLGLLFLVGVFSVNFYLSSIRTVKGAEETPQETLFSVKKKDVALPAQLVSLPTGVKQVVVENFMGQLDVVGTDDKQITVEAVQHVSTSGSSGTGSLITKLIPVVDKRNPAVLTVKVDAILKTDKAAGVGTVDLRVLVPRGLPLVLRSDRGDMDLSNYEGNTLAWAKSGALTVDNLTGSLRADALNGPITARKVRGNITLNGQQRGVTAQDIMGDVTVKSLAGGCTITNVSGKLDLSADNGEALLTKIGGNINATSNIGLITVKDARGQIEARVTNGDIKVSSAVLDAWTLRTSNGSVKLELPQDASVKFLGETDKGVIKGPTKQSPSGSTKPGALITEQMGTGLYPITARSDNGSIFVDLK